MAVLVGGKVRAKMIVSSGLGEDEIKKAAVEQPRIQELIAGKKIVKIIVVPKRTVNLVVV